MNYDRVGTVKQETPHEERTTMTTQNALKLINRHGQGAVVSGAVVGTIGTRTISAPITDGQVQACWVLEADEPDRQIEDYFGNYHRLLSHAVRNCVRWQADEAQA
jgi:hypothetical protein